MDSFTQRMMDRATSRRVEFEQRMKEILSTDVGTDDPNLESLLEEKRQEYREILQGYSQLDAVDDKENSSRAGVSETTKSRLKKLGHLYTGEETEGAFPSPVGYGRRQAEKELKECEDKVAAGAGRYSQQRSKRLAQLATVINNWEDESDKKLPFPSRNEVAASKPVSKPVSSPALKKKMENFDKKEVNTSTFTKSTKKVAWDDKVLQSLEMQGFQRCDSDQHLVFDYQSPEKSPANCSKSPGKCDASKASSKKYPAPAPPTTDVKTSSKKYPAPPPPMPPTNYRSRSVSPVKSRSASPVKYFESPVSAVSASPIRSRSTSPIKSAAASPAKARSVSPVKSRSDSPLKSGPSSPTKTAHIAMALMQEMQPVKKVESVTPKKSQLSPKKPSGSAVMEMAAKYESEKTSPRKVRDPTELSIHDRKLIFERNNGGALLPKVPFGTPLPAKASQSDAINRAKSPDRGVLSRKVEWKRDDVEVVAKDSVTRSILERQKEIEMLRSRWDRKREENHLQGGPSAQFPPDYRQSASVEVNSPPYSPPQPSNKIKMGTRSPVRDRSPDLSPTRSPYLRRRGPEAKPPSQRKSSEWAQSLAQIKKIKVSPPKAGRIYPSVSDIETESEALETESDVHESDFDIPPREAGYASDSEESAMSFGQAVVRLSQTNLKRGITTSSIKSNNSHSSSSPDTSAQESRILHEMDDFLDEALGDASPPKRPRDGMAPHEQVQMLQPSGPSGSSHSDSFVYQPREEIAEKKTTPLVHTVSTYRKNEALRLPRNEMVSMEMEVDQAMKNETPESALVAERIFELEQEMIKQTTIISQATQALNLCIARPEFAGSMEQVEAEKLLLLATSRRTAALHELERLKVEKTIKPGGMNNNDKGSLTIQYISLPIKMCPTEPDKTEHFLCLITSGVTVQATQVLALKKHNLTRGNRLAFTKPITLENLYCDFTVTIEVYKLSCKNPLVGPAGVAAEPKEQKKVSTMLRLTPQKKSTARRNHKMPIESPAGPNSVRSPSFKMVGFVVFSLREVKRNKFTLNKVPYGVPLDGTIELSMSSALKSEIEYRGFLTQFEEVSGFGAWKRKWALLKGSTITFWLYPEHEEHGKIPIDTVDLSIVKTKEIGLVPRDVCARPHTFLLETDCGERKLLSADTVDDRLAWTKAINKSLQLIRAWGGRPY